MPVGRRRSTSGVTNNLCLQVVQHREGTGGVFTARYKVTRLVHHEEFQFVQAAIIREKELKDWHRARKIALIEQGNAAWTDLAEGWSREVETLQYDWSREQDR